MHDLVIKTSDDTDLSYLINQAVNYKLFEENWSLADDYLEYLINCHLGKKRDIYRVALGYLKNKPVAICFIKENVVQFYVKTAYRRRGFASQLFNSIARSAAYRKLLVARAGSPASKEFFEKQRISISS